MVQVGREKHDRSATIIDNDIKKEENIKLG
jgi:hypothetical protein